MNRRQSTDPARLLVIGLALIAAGCSDSGLGPNQGRVRFVLSSGSGAAGVAGAESATVTPTPGTTGATASPSLSGDGEGEHHDYRAFQTANVTFSSILARDQDGVLVNVTMDLPVQVDIVAMDTGGNQVTLPDGDLPAGTYDQLVVVMTQLDGVLKDGTQLSITPPGGGWTAIVPMCSFTVAEGATEPVPLQFMVRQAFTWRNLRYHFQPQLRCSTSDGSTGG
jgi:hypothetical protein